MISYISYFILGLCLLLNLINTILGKKNIFLFIFLLLICWCFAWGTTGGPDYLSYLKQYQNSSLGSLSVGDFGYNFFSLVFSQILGLTFIQFRAFYYAIGYILLGKFLWKYTNKPNKILLLYTIILMPVDVVQIRNFMAMMILLYSFIFFFKKQIIYQLLTILIASLFHITFILYLIIPIIYLLDINNLYKNAIQIIIIIFIGMLIVELGRNFAQQQISIIAEQFVMQENIVYFQKITNMGHWLYWGYQIFILFLLYIIRPNILYNKNQNSFYKLLFATNIILTIYFPLFLFNNNFLRIYRNILMLNLVNFENLISARDNNSITSIFMLIYIIISWFLFSAANNCVPPLFNSSLFF